DRREVLWIERVVVEALGGEMEGRHRSPVHLNNAERCRIVTPKSCPAFGGSGRGRAWTRFVTRSVVTNRGRGTLFRTRRPWGIASRCADRGTCRPRAGRRRLRWIR